jgi:hypothetical protein
MAPGARVLVAAVRHADVLLLEWAYPYLEYLAYPRDNAAVAAGAGALCWLSPESGRGVRRASKWLRCEGARSMRHACGH